MTRQKTPVIGIFLALSGAALNGSIGIFSKVLISHGLTIEAIAFFKTFIAFVLITLLLWRQPRVEQQQAIQPGYTSAIKLWLQIAFCALLGIFVLFFFETTAINMV